MFKQLFAGDMLMLPVLGLLIFIGIFVGAILWVFRRSSAPYYEHMAALPLEPAEGLVTVRVKADSNPNDPQKTNNPSNHGEPTEGAR